MGDRAGGCRFEQGQSPALYPHDVTTKEAKRQALTGAINKGLHVTSTSRTACLLHNRIRQPYPKWAP
jgi:hypothetical protein